MIPILTFIICTECPSKQTSTYLGTSYQTAPPIENGERKNHPKNPNPTWVFFGCFFSKPPRCVAKPKCSNKNAAPNLRGVQRQVESGSIFPYRKGLSSFCHVGDMHKYNICMCVYIYMFFTFVYTMYKIMFPSRHKKKVLT